MGNIACTSLQNNLSSEVPDTVRSNLIPPCKPIDKWQINDVYEWLSRIDDGALKELAIQFRKHRIRGCILHNIQEVQLVEMNAPLGDRMLFNRRRIELFHQYNYIRNDILMDQNSDH